jgi:hypothetical protein
MTTWKKTRFVGVRFRESATRKHKGKPEKYYSIRYRSHGKTVEEGVGWESETIKTGNITPQYCSSRRGEIIHNLRMGEGHTSIKEKRELEQSRKKLKDEEKRKTEQENAPFDALAQRYLEWAEAEKRSWKADEIGYRNHIKPVIGHIPLKNFSSKDGEFPILTITRLKRSFQKKGLSPTTVR